MPLYLAKTLFFFLLLLPCAAHDLQPVLTTTGTNTAASTRFDEALSLLQRAVRVTDMRAKAAPDMLGDETLKPRGRETMLTEASGVYQIGRPLKEGDSIVIIADSFNEVHGFQVQFLDAEGAEAAEFKVQPQKRRVVRNSMEGGKWGMPVICAGNDYPFRKQPSPVKIDLEWSSSGWRASVDGVRERRLDLSRKVGPPEAIKVKGNLVNRHIVLRVAEPEISFGSILSSVRTGRYEALVPHRNGKLLEYVFPDIMKKGDSVHLTADGWEGDGDWSIFFHDKIGNVALAWEPYRLDKLVGRNVMTKGFEAGSDDIWGLEEFGGQWPFLNGTGGAVDVLFEWAWSFWATSVDGIRRPDLDFYHRTTHPISYLTLSPGLKEPKISFHQASEGSSLSAARPDGCDAAGELPQTDAQKLAPLLASLSPSESPGLAGLPEADANLRGLHHVVGRQGVLVLTLARKPERLARTVSALGKVGIVPIPFPATDAKCASPEELDLGMKRANARTNPSVALIRAEKARQTPEQWWQETKVAQAIADSHRRALQAALARPNNTWTAILEDDAVPVGEMDIWEESFAKAWDAIPKGVKLVRLGWCGTGPPYAEHFVNTDGGFKIGQWKDVAMRQAGSIGDSHASDGGCTTAYIVHRSIIPQMLSMFPCTEAVDSCFLWSLFMTFNESHLWGAKNMVNMDVDAKKLNAHDAAIHDRRLNFKYIQAGVLQQARDVPSTRRLANL